MESHGQPHTTRNHGTGLIHHAHAHGPYSQLSAAKETGFTSIPLGTSVPPPSGNGGLHDHPHPGSHWGERAVKKAARELRRIPNIPGLLALALCSIAFLFGRFSMTTSLLPEVGGPSHAVRSTAHGRSLQAADGLSGSGQQLQLVKGINAAAATINPYDIEVFETTVARALEAQKPAMVPGASGEAFYRTIPFQILSWYPRIVVFPNFIDKARAQQIVDRASKAMYPSGLAYRPGEKVEAEQQVRTSRGTFLGADGDTALTYLENKIAAVTLLPRRNGEFWNVLNYKHSQHYDSHMDSFDPKEYGPQYSQRIATVIVVLSDEGLEGGETVFKREGQANANKPISNFTDCYADGGLRYKPRMGDAVLFWSVLPDGVTLDPHALHGSCPVVKGDKWVAVKWIRNKGGFNP